MKKVYHFDSPRQRYDADAAVVWCFDNRFELAFRKFLKRIGVVFADPIKVAGGAKSLASPANESDREFLLEQIRTSIRLHNTRRIILMLHSDCGAYGGLDGGFQGDPAVEAAHHREELRRAARYLGQVLPGVPVQGYFVDFECVWEARLEQALAEGDA